MPDPESSAGQDPNPMQTEENQSVFEAAMAEIEANDDMDEKMIQEATAEDVKPEPEDPPAPEPDEKEPEQEAKSEDEPEKEDEPKKEEETETPPEDQDSDRFAKLAKRGRDIGNRQHQLQQQEAEFEQRQAEFTAQQQQHEATVQQAQQIIDGFKNNPRFLIEAAKQHGVNAKQFGQQIKQILTNPEVAQASQEITALQAQMNKIEQLLTSNQEQQTQKEQERAQAEAAEAGHQQLKAYMSEDAAKKAYPLATRLDETLRRQYSAQAARYLLQHGLEVSQDNICEVIEGTLEQITRQVSGDNPAPPPRDAPAPKAATPTGQRSAPSIGNDSKTSGDAGVDWDTMSLGDDVDEFTKAVQREVASG